MEEMLDLVDENDQIIGEVARSEANSNPKLIHREIAIIIYDNKKRVLLQKRSTNKKVMPGYWIISVAGHIEKGADPLGVAHRELQEELGFDADLKFVGKELEVFPNERHFVYCYVGEYFGQKITIQKEEVDQYRFFDAKDLDKLVNSDEKCEEGSIDWVRKFWK